MDGLDQTNCRAAIRLVLPATDTGSIYIVIYTLKLRPNKIHTLKTLEFLFFTFLFLPNSFQTCRLTMTENLNGTIVVDLNYEFTVNEVELDHEDNGEVDTVILNSIETYEPQAHPSYYIFH
jgi:hypothetical protein